ncbi:glycogenin glucosyltransferase [Agyrium rufum]|nr:glycogenin glucosyltransferase [Agyrium rufum]
MVLAHSLRDNGTKKQLAALVTLDTVKSTTISELKKLYDHTIPVDRILNRSPANLYLMNRPDLSSTFTKIALWRQIQFSRIIYVDADMVALRAPDELFHNSDASFSATPDIGWPDCFNSGLMVLTPNMGDYYALLALAQRGISFDGADQGLLNMHFRNWERLSFTYNCTPSGSYQYVPAYRHFQSSISMVHYIGKDKPWLAGRDRKGATGVYEELLGRWWAVYDRHYRAPPPTSSISGQGSQPQRTVQEHVNGEELADMGYGFSSTEPSAGQASQTSQAGQSHVRGLETQGNTMKMPFSEKAPQRGQSIEKKVFEPTPIVNQTPFTAPLADWDPARQAPPSDSKPEAVNFPTQTYTMSGDRNFFQPPKAYPEPPRNMYYEVPKAETTKSRPKPLFPWEENQSKPTRIFPEDYVSPEEEVKSLSPEEAKSPDAESVPDEYPLSPITPTINITPEPFSSYARTNAWDEMPEIERYISALQASRKGKVQVLSPSGTSGSDGAILSPSDLSSVIPPSASPRTRQRLQEQQQQTGAAGGRRPSMKLTDFPTAIERPSLPVTPAPIRRPSFWGEDYTSEPSNTGTGAADGGPLNLPGAEGVPRQQDWDPLKKLDELQRKQSAVLMGMVNASPPIGTNVGDGTATGPTTTIDEGTEVFVEGDGKNEAGTGEGSAGLGETRKIPDRKLADGGQILLPTAEETDFPMTTREDGFTGLGREPGGSLVPHSVADDD